MSAAAIVLSGPVVLYAQSALVSWSPNPDPTVSYVVSYGTQPRAVRPYSTVVEVGQKPQWRFTPPSPTDAYYFAVQTKNPTGTLSGYSGEVLLEPTGRVSVSRSAGDLNADGYVDLLWRNQQSGALQAWLMRGTALTQPVSLSSAPPMTDANWKIVGTNDFTGDGTADIVWQNQAANLVTIWAMNGTSFLRSESPAAKGVSAKDWIIRAVGDLDGDGKADLIWQHRTNGQVAAWIMNGSHYTQSRGISGQTAGPGTTIAGAGDFDGDHRTDLVWYNETTGAVTYWLMNGTTYLATRPTYPDDAITDTSWTIRAVADLNGDSKPDLIWQHRASGLLAAWLMNGTTIMRVTPLDPDRVTDLNWILTAPR